MSFDIFLQAFARGEAGMANRDALVAILRPLIHAPPSGSFVRVKTADGGADVYGIDQAARGLMINHASGQEIWDVMIAIARAGGVAIMPVGCAACVASETMIEALPDELRADAVVVHSGRELRELCNG